MGYDVRRYRHPVIMKETSSKALFGRLTSSRWALTAAFLGGVCMALACSPQKTSLDTLRNQGLLPISAENPFMGANVLLGKEMEQSMYLYNFVKDRGAPQAIEITGEDSESMQAHFFYAPSKEEYIHAIIIIIIIVLSPLYIIISFVSSRKVVWSSSCHASCECV